MRKEIYRRTIPLMGTLVTIQVAGHGADTHQEAQREEIVKRAFEWFRRIEACCTRFDARSEVMRLATQIGVVVPVSAILYETVQFALVVSEESGGAFDPTVGYPMELRGFNREYRGGQIVQTAPEQNGGATYRDVRLDPKQKTITLLRPLLLDLGAVAKGLALDMAARELRTFESFAIDAGGDLYLGRCNPDGAPWSVGIRHPRSDGELIDSVRVSNRAVCTSGDYERRCTGVADGHHILDPRTGDSAPAAASVTVVAPTAMLADALATAAFVLGPADGIRLLERLGVEGLLVTPDLERHATRGMYSDYKLSGAAILPDAEGTSPHRSGDSDRAGRAA